MGTTLRAILAKLRRDRGLGWRLVTKRGLRYAGELVTARLRLRRVDVVGAHPRTLGTPRIVNDGRIEIGRHVLLRSLPVPVELVTGPGAILRVGRGVRVNYGTSINADCSVTIGDRVRIGPYAMIVDTDFHDPLDRARRPGARPVVIEDDVWIGAKASVLKGVRIGRGAIVGVGAVVTHDVPPFTIVGGVPARVMGTLDPERFIVREAS